MNLFHLFFNFFLFNFFLLKKEKIYYEENENKNIKISKYQKPELNDYSMPIIDLEDSNIRMEIEEYPKSFSLEKKRKENSEFQSENIGINLIIFNNN